jgi:metal-responsive CopG/Arc/MetJ family transcriptional regulator
MKVKTSISVDKDLLETVDTLSRHYKNRSEFIEAALQNYISQIIQKTQNARDLEIINRRADDLNKEAMDVLEYQVNL